MENDLGRIMPVERIRSSAALLWTELQLRQPDRFWNANDRRNYTPSPGLRRERDADILFTVDFPSFRNSRGIAIHFGIISFNIIYSHPLESNYRNSEGVLSLQS